VFFIRLRSSIKATTKTSLPVYIGQILDKHCFETGFSSKKDRLFENIPAVGSL